MENVQYYSSSQQSSGDQGSDLDLELSLRLPSRPVPAPFLIRREISHTATRHTRGTRRASLRPCNSRAKTETISPPYLWSTDRRAVVHTIRHLKSNQIMMIRGEVQCRRCQRKYEIEYDLVSKFKEIVDFIKKYNHFFYDRAPSSWMSPSYPMCQFCGLENGVRPVIAKKNRDINWLFLLLGQMLGYLNLIQLKYFCRCTKNHRTGAKNRLLYLTYISLCHQLDPSACFRRSN